MRKSIIYILVASTGMCLYACKADPLLYEPSDYVNIYMPQAREKPAIRSFTMADTAQSIIYGAVYSGPDYPANDVEVRFKAGDPALVESFNSEMNTAYPIMPEGSYELEQTTVISKGKSSSAPLKIKVKTAGALVATKDYLLPVTIEQVSGGLNIRERLKTSYFLIRAIYKNYDRSAWTVVGFSSQNSAAEAVVKAIDGDINTFWHSQYAPTRLNPPHFFSFDMSEVKTIHGFSFSARRNAANGRFKNIRIQVSMDGTDWQDSGSFALANVDENTIYLSSAVDAKFFKIWIDEAHGNITCSLAEINAF